MDLVLPRMLELNTIQADDAAGLMMSVLQVLNDLKYKNQGGNFLCPGFPRDGSP